MGLHKVKVSKQSPEVYCKGCTYYENREKHAKFMEKVFGQAGKWDFAECYANCYKREGKYND